MIKVVTDSSVDLPPDMARDLDVTVVPLSIHFGDRTYIDGEDIDATTFYRLLRTEPTHPRTAQPSVGRFEEAFRRIAAGGHEIVAITIASSLSGTFNSASVAARNVPEARVTVVDSGTASMAIGSMVIRAARLGREGQSAEQIKAVLDEMRPRLNIFLLVETLSYLQRGGRIGRASSLVGTLLDIKPIITLKDGVVTPLRRVRTHNKALQEIVTLVSGDAPIEEIYVMHADAKAEAERLASMLRPVVGDIPVPVHPLGPVVGVHIGPGSLGTALLRAQR
ncbi:MAG TPA: DegV family protein [Chloroflexota bacterium]|nr:DegV family protein [Chloroflexota bacterium]